MNLLHSRMLCLLVLTTPVGLLTPALVAATELLYDHHGNERPILWIGKSPWESADPAHWPGDISLAPAVLEVPDDGDSLFPPATTVDLHGLIVPAASDEVIASFPRPRGVERFESSEGSATIPGPATLPLLIVAGLAAHRRRRRIGRD